LALTGLTEAQDNDTLIVPDPCDKPCITEISTVPWAPPAPSVYPKVVYGDDDRIDVYQETDEQRQQWAAATCALISSSRMTQNLDGSWTLSSPAAYLRWGVPACDGEPFGDQPTAASCTGFMVADDLIVTAGHCYSTSSISTICFVFGFWMLDETTPRLNFLESEVYRGVEVVSYASSGDYDHSIVRVDRPITAPDAQAFVVRREGTILPGEYVGVIGHPSGLPMKIAFGNTYVRSSDLDGFFVANLDTYGGNSGSPVINATTGILEGILVRGATDFILDTVNNCFYSNVLPSDGGRGEDVTKATVFASYIPGQGGYAGSVKLDANSYFCEDTMKITVVDPDLEGQASVSVTIETTFGDVETVTLPAKAPMSNEFINYVSLQTATPIEESGMLEVNHGDVITATYLDEANEVGLPETRTASADIDCRAPEILNMRVSYLSGTQAQILITTDEESYVSVYSGEACSDFSIIFSSSWNTNHTIALGTLLPDTRYYFAIEASDWSGNNSYDDNNGVCYSFYTSSTLNYFTEFFSVTNPLDLDYMQLTLVPFDHPDQYQACTKSVTALPVSPGDGLLTLGDDASVEIPFTHGAPILFYGTEYDRMFVGSNGYITFGTGDNTYQPMYSLHFQMPRISGLMCDLNPSRRGAVYCTRVSDRYVVTFVGVPVYSSTGQYPPENSHTFQIELYFNGAIRITWLDLYATSAVVGLSAGLGVPSDYVSENLAGFTNCDTLQFDGEYHSADINKDWSISLDELLRVIQLYNVGEYHCSLEYADGYDAGGGLKDCLPHKSDYAPADWKISLTEMLRLIQLYNAGGYRPDDATEDGYRPIP